MKNKNWYKRGEDIIESRLRDQYPNVDSRGLLGNRIILAFAVVGLFSVTMELSAETYYTQSSGIVSTPSNWNTLVGGGGVSPADFTGSHTWIIQADHVMTMSEDWSVGAGGSAVVEINGSLTVSGLFLVQVNGTLTINGVMVNTGSLTSADFITATGGITVNGTYNHARDGGNLPSMTWAVGSLCAVTGWTTTGYVPPSFDQEFYNFTWSCPMQTTKSISLDGNVKTVHGMFTFSNIGNYEIWPDGDMNCGAFTLLSGQFELTEEFRSHSLKIEGDFLINGGNFIQSLKAPGSITVGGDFVMSNGVYNLGGTTGTLTVSGDFELTGGTFYMGLHGGVGTISVGGDFTHTGGLLDNGYRTDTQPPSNGNIVFTGNGNIQTFTSGGAVGTTDLINYTVNSGAYLQTAAGSTVVNGTTFTLSPGAKLGIRSADGIAATGASGNIRTSTRAYSSEAGYIFNGTSSQTTGDGLPATVENLFFDNVSGIISLNTAQIITGNLEISEGSVVNPGGYMHQCGMLTLAGEGQPTGSYGFTGSGADYELTEFFFGTGQVQNNVNTWLGNTSGWNEGTNWSGGIPTSGTNVVITSSSAFQPIISSTTSADCRNLMVNQGASLTIESDGVTSSGSLIVHGRSYGTVTYNRYLRPEETRGDRHFFSSPVSGQDLQSFLIENGSRVAQLGSEYQVWQWNEVDGTWPVINTGNFISGRGYNLDQATGAGGLMTFRGSVINNTDYSATSPYLNGYTARSLSIDYNENALWADNRSWTNYGGGGWNLMGNPFTSALDATEFISVNAGKFDPHYQALYVYDGREGEENYKYVASTIPGWTEPDYEFGGSHGNYIQTGQGFYLLALYDGIVFNFTPEMQTHQNNTILLKSNENVKPWPGVKLQISYGEKKQSTVIVFNNEMTPENDPGFDVGLLASSSEYQLYTIPLASDHKVKLTRQALPLNYHGMNIIPIGLDSQRGGEVVFSAVTVPYGRTKYWLEDKETGIFTDLTTDSYKVVIPPETNGTGRFYLVTSVRTPFARQNPNFIAQELQIWTFSGDVIIKGEVGVGSLCEIYDIHGSKILEKKLNGGDLNTIDIPSGFHGVFLVRVTDGEKFTTAKVVLH